MTRHNLTILKLFGIWSLMLCSIDGKAQRQIPKPNSFVLNLSLSSNLAHAFITPELSYRFNPIIFNNRETIFIGSGIAIDDDLNYSFVEKLQIGLLHYRANYHRGGMEEYTTLYAGIQYTLSKDLQHHYLAPELGYNFHVAPKFRIYLSTLYQLPKTTSNWYNNFYLQTGLRYFLSNKTFRPKGGYIPDIDF